MLFRKKGFTDNDCRLIFVSSPQCAYMIFIYLQSYNRYSSLGWFIWTQHNDQLPVGLLAELVERRYRRGHVFTIPHVPEFFSGLISTTSSIVFIAARISYIRFFTGVHII